MSLSFENNLLFKKQGKAAYNKPKMMGHFPVSRMRELQCIGLTFFLRRMLMNALGALVKVLK